MDEVRIAVSGSEVTASVHGAGETILVLGHGAGGTRRQPFLVRLAEALSASGRGVFLYNFPYSEKGRRAPDPPAVLEATARAASAYARGTLGARRLVVGGKSMGGRIASQVVAQGDPADGLVFQGYPLHPPGKPDVLRDRHLSSITVPMLFVQGTRDAFARPELLDGVLARLGDRATLYRVEGGDHSFAVPKAAGRPAAAVEAEIAKATVDWLSARGL